MPTLVLHGLCVSFQNFDSQSTIEYSLVVRQQGSLSRKRLLFKFRHVNDGIDHVIRLLNLISLD